MIVVAIIGILAAIAIPQFAQLISKSQEGATKGNLGTIRSALSIYYGDTEGRYPEDDGLSLTAGLHHGGQVPSNGTKSNANNRKPVNNDTCHGHTAKNCTVVNLTTGNADRHRWLGSMTTIPVSGRHMGQHCCELLRILTCAAVSGQRY